MLLYMKASLSADEPADILEYSKRAKEFPHETTADQWFDESQFESYRELGYHVFKSSFVEESPKPWKSEYDGRDAPMQGHGNTLAERE